ncbi:MAG: hypothetical protein K6F68_02290 [Clostridiales bacterium]|nr:hypothetical protein [Clostridiales bacterium]
MNRNRISYRVLMLFCSNTVLQIMGFAYRMALSREAGALSLGLNSLVMQVYGIVVSVCISGLNVAVTALSSRTEKERMGRLVLTALPVLFALWSAMAVPLFLLRKALAERVLGDGGVSSALTLMLICILMTGVENVLKSIHIGTKNVSRCAVSEILEQGVRFVLVILLLKNVSHPKDSFTVFLIILGMTMSEFVSVSFLSVSYYSLFGRISFKRSEGGVLSDLVRIAFPATLTAVSTNVFSSVGALILPSLLVKFGLTSGAAVSEIGVVNTVAVPITMFPMALVGAVAAVIMPEISETVSKKGDPTGIVKKSFAAVLITGVLSTSALAVFGGNIAVKLFGRSVDAGVFLLLLIKALVIFCQVVSVSVLNGLMKQKTVLLFAVTGEAYQLILILLLAPVLGMKGWALGMIIGELARLAMNLFAVTNALKNCGNSRGDMIKSSENNEMRGNYGPKEKKARVPFRLRYGAEVSDAEGENCPRGGA